MAIRGKKAPPSPTPAAAVSLVLGDDDLLREILLRVGFPTILVRAALVCKRWLRNASDPAFLRSFRALHPPRLLGLYVTRDSGVPGPRFVPLPQPPELAVVFRRASFLLRDGFSWISDCCNGRVLAFAFTGLIFFGVCSPLRPDIPILLQPLLINVRRQLVFKGRYPLLPEDGGDGQSYTIVALVHSGRRVFARVHTLPGSCYVLRSSLSIELPASWQGYMNRSLLVRGKLYMLGQTGFILGLDLTSTHLFFINLPDGVQMLEHMANVELSPAHDSGFYLIHLMGFKIYVWLYGTDGGNSGNWELVDTICLRQAFGHHAKPTWESGDAHVGVNRVGGNAELLIQVGHEVFHMHMKSRVVEKVFEMASQDEAFKVHPFMMVWPPTFPALNYEHDQD